ncbi:MAG TPA: hypothetical protein VJK02_23055 [Anaerolineales bacterium]|nr:hypothetical protein [Anaerolineales bacterium]
MAKQGRRNRPSSSSWPWWKAATLAPVGLGVFGAVFAFVPPYSSTALKVAIGLILAGTVAAVWSVTRPNWWAAIAFINSWLFLMLGTAMRAWANIIPQVWVWLVPLVAAYVVAWALPAISPKLSARLLREQFAPETRWGRGCLTLFLVVGPAAGALGASVGMYGSRFGQGTAVIIVIAVLFSAVSVGFAQAVAEHSWPKRPWAQHSDSGLKDAAR